jgi:arylsulfatase A-like enzyme
MLDLVTKSGGLGPALLMTLVVVFASKQAAFAQAAAEGRPNILLIYSDDAGYRDFSFQGSKKFKTPHLDKLAAEGTVFTSAYACSAVCGPSRAGLLTGRYQQRFGYFSNPGPNNALPLTEKTVGNAMQSLGYRTGLIGKWHMGKAEAHRPLKRGFDYFFGFLAGHRSYFPYKDKSVEKAKQPKYRLMHNNKLLDETMMDFYTTDLFAEKAIEFMDDSRKQGKPFFLFLSHNAVHGPLEALDKDKETHGPEKNPKRQTLGGMTVALDRSTGRIMDWLKANNLRENTLVVFTNDNGGSRKTLAYNWPLRGYKGEETEGGIRVPMIISWPGKLPKGQKYDHPVIQLDLFTTFLAAAGGLGEYDTAKLDGVNLLPHVRGEKSDAPHEAIFFQRGNAAVRAGDWKLIERNVGAKKGTYELYDLAKDIGEKKNLVEERPEVVGRLKVALKAWQAQNIAPIWVPQPAKR